MLPFYLLVLSSFGAPSIVGSWHLVQLERQNEAGRWEPRCASPSGIITYTASGYMAVGINCMKSEGSSEPSTEKDHVTFYTGKYEVGKNTVTHHVQNSATPDFFRKDLVREFEFQGPDRVMLKGIGKNGRMVRLVWQRAK